VSKNKIGDTSISYLSHVLLEPSPPGLRHIDISDHRLNKKGFQKLAKGVRYLSTLTSLDISWGVEHLQHWAARPPADLSHPTVDLSLPDRKNFELLWKRFCLDVTAADLAAEYVKVRKEREAAKAAAKDKKGRGPGGRARPSVRGSVASSGGGSASRSPSKGAAGRAPPPKPPLTGRKRHRFTNGSSSGSSCDSKHVWWSEFDDFISDHDANDLADALALPLPKPVAPRGGAAPADGAGEGAPQDGGAGTGLGVIAVSSPAGGDGDAAPAPERPPLPPPKALVNSTTLTEILACGAGAHGGRIRDQSSGKLVVGDASGDDGADEGGGPLFIARQNRHLGMPARFGIPPPHVPRRTTKKKRGVFGFGKGKDDGKPVLPPKPPAAPRGGAAAGAGAGAGAGSAAKAKAGAKGKPKADPLAGLNAFERRKKLIEMRRRDMREKRMLRKRQDWDKLGVTFVGQALARMVRNHNLRVLM
jgi:hypothetical protein